VKSMTWINEWRADLNSGYTRSPGEQEKEALISPTQSRGIARFGPFALDLRTGALMRDGRYERLPQQPAQLLLVLGTAVASWSHVKSFVHSYGQKTLSWISIMGSIML